MSQLLSDHLRLHLHTRDWAQLFMQVPTKSLLCILDFCSGIKLLQLFDLSITEKPLCTVAQKSSEIPVKSMFSKKKFFFQCIGDSSVALIVKWKLESFSHGKSSQTYMQMTVFYLDPLFVISLSSIISLNELWKKGPV